MSLHKYLFIIFLLIKIHLPIFYNICNLSIIHDLKFGSKSMKRLISIFVLLFLLVAQPSYAIQQAFYVLRGNDVSDAIAEPQWITTIEHNLKSINLIISQAFEVDSYGTVWGTVNQPIYDLAKKNHIQFMALLTNQNFDPNKVDSFLKNKSAVTKAINHILALCKKNKLDGIQVDFEEVPIQDKTLFTQFYSQLSHILHQHGFKISATLFPETTNLPTTTVLKRLYNNWDGAYDFKAIGKASDFVTLMTYNQSTAGTTPGPVAGIPWVEKVIAYTLNYIPANKISLGIPAYSNYWYMTMDHGRSEAIGTNISYDTVQALLAENHQRLKWDDSQKVPYTFYFKNQFGEYIFAENAKSFREKLKLIKKYHLRGFSVWRLGMEDPAIWQLLGA